MAKAHERMLPQNIEAERGVLGSLLIDPEAILQISDFLKSEDFYRDAHQTIYSTIVHLYDHRTPADAITLCDALEQQEKLEDIGGIGYILSLVNEVPTSGNVAHYGRIVSRTALLRRLIKTGSDIVAQAFEDSEIDAGSTLEKAEQAIFAVSQYYHGSSSHSAHVRDLVASYFERLEYIYNSMNAVHGVHTGFAQLDSITSGLQRSDFIVLAGRPGMGKTSAALSIAYNAAKNYKHKIGIFSLEMSAEQLIQRLVSMESGIDQQNLRTGWVMDEEWERVINAIGTISDLDIWIDDTAGLTLTQLRSKARRWVSEHHIELIILDYLQLLRMSQIEGNKQRNREQEVAEISKTLKELARELNIPVLALAQLSRAVESRASKVPQLSDLRESGQLEADADIVLFIYRDDVYHPDTDRPNTADIIVAKQRNGPTGEVCVAFDRHQTRFRDISTYLSPDVPRPIRSPFPPQPDEIVLDDEDEGDDDEVIEDEDRDAES